MMYNVHTSNRNFGGDDDDVKPIVCRPLCLLCQCSLLKPGDSVTAGCKFEAHQSPDERGKTWNGTRLWAGLVAI